MTLTRKLALVLCLVGWLSSYSNAQNLIPGQEYTTGNIVIPTTTTSGSTWTNGVYQNNLSCWFWGLIGYCGPNAIVRPDGNINFSFGTTNLYQTQAIASVLPNSGSGLQVTGYNFGFTAKNGNGWDDGRVDYLKAYVNLYNSGNQIAYSKEYDLNYKFNWTNFNFSETFTSPYATKDLSNVQYGFVGRDNNYWAGPYGPEINNVSFSLKYSVDPCASNVLYAPSCPGYLDALAKLTPPTTSTITIVESPTKSAITQTEPVAVTQPATVQLATTVAQPVSSQPRQTLSTSKILSIISGVQTQVASIERSAVQAALQDSAKLANKAVQDAENTAQQQSQQSFADSQQNFQNTTTPQNFSINTRTDILSTAAIGNQRINSILPITNTTREFAISPIVQQTPQPAVQPTNNYTLTNNLSVSSILQPNIVAIPQSPYTLLPPKLDPLPEVKIEQQQVIGPTNLLDPFVNQKPVLENASQQQAYKPINQKAQDSEVAGGVTIASIAKQPQGFETYMAILQDVPFYKSTEIYKNQTPVDNQRIMRALSGASDAKHKELVDSQYRR